MNAKELERAVDQRTAALARYERLAERRAATLRRNRWVLPLLGYRVTATFGMSSALWSSLHTGVDLAAPTGTPVRSVGSGTVTFAGYDGPYGYKVVVTHLDGTETWYAHLDSIAVAGGEEVESGEGVGTVGSTGNVTGPHLHFEVRPGGSQPVDPMTALAQRGLFL